MNLLKSIKQCKGYEMVINERDIFMNIAHQATRTGGQSIKKLILFYLFLK